LVVVIAFAYLCFTVLAPWQLGKNTKDFRGKTLRFRIRSLPTRCR